MRCFSCEMHIPTQKFAPDGFQPAISSLYRDVRTGRRFRVLQSVQTRLAMRNRPWNGIGASIIRVRYFPSTLVSKPTGCPSTLVVRAAKPQQSSKNVRAFLFIRTHICFTP